MAKYGSVLILTLALARPAAAKAPVTPQSVTAVDTMLTCRSVANPEARLACYDDNATKLVSAVADKSVVVIDKARAHEASRALFGFSIPNFGGLFGDGDGTKQIESSVASYGRNGDGGLILTLADGSVWSQTDDKMTIEPRHGDKVTVSRGTMGSFFIATTRSNLFKAKRVG